MKVIARLIFVTSFLLYPLLLTAQTCGCAGAPLLSSQSISSASEGNLLFGLTYEYDKIDDLYEGTNELKNRTVRRNTQTTLFEAHYGLTDRITLSGTFTFIQKNRETGLQTSGPNTEITTRGLGDGLFMLKYVLHKNTMQSQYQLAVGGGVKAPLGSFTITNGGLQLNADMQPGTGAWDEVLWSYFSKTFAPNSTINLFMTNSFRYTGKADRFSNTDDSYEFGNELVSSVGVGDKLIKKLSYVLRIEYRSVASNERNNETLPNTGGKWINIRSALSYQVNDELSVKVSGMFPLYRNLDGTQSTTTYSLSGSIFYNFSGNTIF